MNILFCAAECAPIAKVGGLGDVVGSLPKALLALGADARVLLPRYKNIGSEYLGDKVGELPVAFGGAQYRVGVFQTVLPASAAVLYLLDEPGFFGSGGVYEQAGAAPGGEGEIAKFLFYNRCAAAFLQAGIWRPDVLHIHDWHAAYLAWLVKDLNIGAPTLLTIHNLAMQGMASAAALQAAGAAGASPAANLLQIGIENAGRVNTVSPSYAREILTPEFGEGLDGVLRQRGDVLGILNGIDEAVWNESSDPYITNHYGKFSAGLKLQNKTVLQKQMGLAVDPEMPLAGIVSRLTSQKGLDLLMPIAESIDALPVQLAVVGVGEPEMERFFAEWARRRPEKIAFLPRFDERLAHEIYAAGDLFLMPSRFEPCGLGQMIAMHYGSIPIVRAVGGLKDSVIALNADGSNMGAATGFHIVRDDAQEL
ncbi:MAG TPA: glycogen/starch synthase, partial [Alphaproteobacteria bacterium]|nr:glycogen/starch synthase [Alphaproteobacteria bacterium]